MSSVFLNNLDDFILPSQNCIVVPPRGEVVAASDIDKGSSAKISLRLEDDTSIPSSGSGIIRTVASTSAVAAKASVSLSDCLACSGDYTVSFYPHEEGELSVVIVSYRQPALSVSQHTTDRRKTP